MFIFRLEPVLKHRKHQEELIQKEIAQLQQKIDERKGEMEQMMENMHGSIAEIHRLQLEGVTISEQLIYSQYIDHLKSNMKRLEMEIGRLCALQEEKRLELMEAVKRRKMIEKLKEKKNLLYLDELLKTEQKLLEEAAVCRYKVGSAAMAG
ncbi:MAG: flagellar export protein FliJ [Thermodesulfobacteriota bacterium]